MDINKLELTYNNYEEEVSLDDGRHHAPFLL